MTHDGDIIIDPHVRQEMGLLISDPNNWALPTIRAAPMYKFARPDQLVKDRAMFVYRHDTPAPTHSGMVVNRVLKAVSGMAERGAWKPYKSVAQKIGQSKYLIAAIAVAAAAFMLYQSNQSSAEKELLEAPDRGRPRGRNKAGHRGRRPQPRGPGGAAGGGQGRRVGESARSETRPRS